MQSALGLDGGKGQGNLPYSLSSLRPGGATFWLQKTKDAEYVRRKEVYLQESVFASYTQKMTQESQSRVSHLCMHFNEILLKAIGLKHAFIPESAWPRLW